MSSVKQTGLPLPSSVLIDEDGKKAAGKSPASSEWPIKAVAVLLDMYVQKFFAGRGYLRGNDWEEVRSKVNAECGGLKSLKSIKQCRDKVDSLKRRYKIEKRKAVSGSEITWPFFTKLDNMMSSVFKQGKGFELIDGREQRPSLDGNGEGCGEENEDDDEDEEEEEEEGEGDDDCCDGEEDNGCDDRKGCLSSSHERHAGENGIGQVSLPPLAWNQNRANSSRTEDGRITNGGGYGLVQSRDTLRFVSVIKKAEASSSDKSSEKEKRAWHHPPWGIATSKHPPPPAPPKLEAGETRENPLQALADALTGFSQVYARVELTKMEIIAKTKLEIAKLGCNKKRKRKKKHVMMENYAKPL